MALEDVFSNKIKLKYVKLVIKNGAVDKEIRKFFVEKM